MVINSRFVDRKLVIAENGTVESNTGFNVNAASPINIVIGPARWTTAEVGSVRFASSVIPSFDGQFPLDSPFTNSLFMGVTPTFTFNETTRHVDITDRRTNGGFLTVYPIDVINAGAAPKVTLESSEREFRLLRPTQLRSDRHRDSVHGPRRFQTI